MNPRLSFEINLLIFRNVDVLSYFALRRVSKTIYGYLQSELFRNKGTPFRWKYARILKKFRKGLSLSIHQRVALAASSGDLRFVQYYVGLGVTDPSVYSDALVFALKNKGEERSQKDIVDFLLEKGASIPKHLTLDVVLSKNPYLQEYPFPNKEHYMEAKKCIQSKDITKFRKSLEFFLKTYNPEIANLLVHFGDNAFIEECVQDPIIKKMDTGLLESVLIVAATIGKKDILDTYITDDTKESFCHFYSHILISCAKRGNKDIMDRIFTLFPIEERLLFVKEAARGGHFDLVQQLIYEHQMFTKTKTLEVNILQDCSFWLDAFISSVHSSNLELIQFFYKKLSFLGNNLLNIAWDKVIEIGDIKVLNFFLKECDLKVVDLKPLLWTSCQEGKTKIALLLLENMKQHQNQELKPILRMCIQKSQSKGHTFLAKYLQRKKLRNL